MTEVEEESVQVVLEEVEVDVAIDVEVDNSEVECGEMETQVISGYDKDELQGPTSSNSEPVLEVTAMDMDEPGLGEHSIYVITSVLDKETGELMNLATPYNAMEIPLQIQQNRNAETGEQTHYSFKDSVAVSESQIQFLNEHDYEEFRNIRVNTEYTSEVETKPMPTIDLELDDNLMEAIETDRTVTFSNEDIKPISIVSTTGNDKKTSGNRSKNGNEQELNAANFSEPADEMRYVPKNKKTKGQVRNIDLMQLPFSYAGQSFTVQAQKLILNVYDFFRRNKKDTYALDRIGTPQDKAGRCLNISSSVIGKIRKRYKSGRLEVPGKRRTKIKRILDKVDAEKEAILRQIYHEMRNTGIPATVPALLEAARDKIDFEGSRTSFRRILHRMGFKYGKQNKKVVILDGSGYGVRTSS